MPSSREECAWKARCSPGGLDSWRHSAHSPRRPRSRALRALSRRSVGFARSAHPLDHHHSPRRRLVLDPRRRHRACLGRPDRRGSPADVRHARAAAHRRPDRQADGVSSAPVRCARVPNPDRRSRSVLLSLGPLGRGDGGCVQLRDGVSGPRRAAPGYGVPRRRVGSTLRRRQGFYREGDYGEEPPSHELLHMKAARTRVGCCSRKREKGRRVRDARMHRLARRWWLKEARALTASFVGLGLAESLVSEGNRSR